MNDLDRLARSCGVLIELGGSGFAHRATAWSVGPGEWITAGEFAEDSADLRLLCCADGRDADIQDCERDGPIVGFRSVDCGSTLSMAEESQELSKRMPLLGFGYPSVIDHPSFRLHRGSLDPERYLPYLCPWLVEGHLGLFTHEEGWLTGDSYPGMNGAPVLDEGGQVVGVLLPSENDRRHPPLSRFWRLV